MNRLRCWPWFVGSPADSLWWPTPSFLRDYLNPVRFRHYSCDLAVKTQFLLLLWHPVFILTSSSPTCDLAVINNSRALEANQNIIIRQFNKLFLLLFSFSPLLLVKF